MRVLSAGNEPKSAAGERDRNIPDGLMGIIGIVIEGDLRSWPNAECRLILEKQLRDAVGPRADGVILKNAAANAEGAGLLRYGRGGYVVADSRRDPDACGVGLRLGDRQKCARAPFPAPTMRSAFSSLRPLSTEAPRKRRMARSTCTPQVGRERRRIPTGGNSFKGRRECCSPNK